MLVATLALPYFGCVDVLQRTLENNTMVFGVSILSLAWLSATWLIRHPLLLQARSTVLFFYGLLALASMILRIFIRGQLPPNIIMDYSGPAIIAVVMVFAAYYSRSLVPAGIGAVILIILFPELKSHFNQEFENAGWGTGLGGAVSAFLLIFSCFFLRQTPWLRHLNDGDLFPRQTSISAATARLHTLCLADPAFGAVFTPQGRHCHHSRQSAEIRHPPTADPIVYRHIRNRTGMDAFCCILPKIQSVDCRRLRGLVGFSRRSRHRLLSTGGVAGKYDDAALLWADRSGRLWIMPLLVTAEVCLDRRAVHPSGISDFERRRTVIICPLHPFPAVRKKPYASMPPGGFFRVVTALARAVKKSLHPWRIALFPGLD